jgi:membrane protease YdiL (CAAX protease family)
MSILLNPPNLSRRTTPGRAVIWFGLYFVTAIAGGALLGGFLIRLGLEAESGWWADFVEANRVDRILRRFQTFLAVVLAPWMLKKIGWRGFRDMGWNSDQPRSQRHRDFWRWFGIGFLAMPFIFSISIYTGVRYWDMESTSGWIGPIFSSFLVTGIGVGIIEETLTRGVLFRSLARAWTPWVGAWVSSLLFAWAHFMKATAESFDEGVWAVLVSSLFADFSNPAVPLKFLNMLVFGLVLSRLVHHRGDIWAAVGLHASAVGCIKWFSAQTEYSREVPYQSWIGGHSSKFDDGWLLALLLLFLLCAIEWAHRHPASKRVHF